MSQVSMQQVKELRDRTQAGLNDCRSALLESAGDMDKAVEIILKKGLAKSAKRAGAVTAEGVVATSLSADRRRGVVAEVNIQTDFAARNQDFLAFVDKVIEAALAAKPGADLSQAPYPGGEGTLEDNRKVLVGKLGENITLRRWTALEVSGPGTVLSYVHMGGKIGVLLSLETEAHEKPEVVSFAENVAMQVAAMSPQFMSETDVDETTKAKQSAIFDAQLAEEGKPEQVRGKIIEGKLKKWMREICLLSQQSVVDSDKTVDQVRGEVEKATGAQLKLVAFARYERGEGIEKPQGPDFATEVAQMAKN